MRQTAARTTPADPWPAGDPSLVLFHVSGPITKLGLEPSLAAPAFRFRGPASHGLHIENPESRTHASPNHAGANIASRRFGQCSE